MQRFTDLLIRFRRDERGVFMILFAVLAIVLIATSGAVVDFTQVQQARTRAQVALDAATLALQNRIGKDDATVLKSKAQTILTERIGDAKITTVVTSATPDPNGGKLNIQAYIVVPTSFVQLVGITSIRANLEAEVQRASSDLEVGMALDVTQSMAGDKIEALIDSTNSLIDQVVQTTQTPTYSKMALAPYSMAVNVGSYVDEARGDVTMGKTITDIKWAVSTLRNITIASMTKTPNNNNNNPTVINFSSAQDFIKGDYVWINNSSGIGTSVWTMLGVYRVGDVATDKKSFKLRNADNTDHNSKNYSGTYTANSGRITKCLNPSCELIVKAVAHGIADGNYSYITSSPSGTGYATSGTYALTNKAWEVKSATTDTFIAGGTDPRMITTSATSTTPAAYTGTGGTSFCTTYGCNYYRYQRLDNGYNIYRPTDCVVERPVNNTYAFTDADTNTARVGFYYNSNGNDCLGSEIVPLTSDLDTLHDTVDALKVAGSTAGQIGLAWAWYMISPNFIKADTDLGDVWPPYLTNTMNSKPAPYGQKNLIKAVILMTDGIFNTIYDHGVPSADSSSLSGGNTVRSADNAPLGSSIDQAKALCTSIKTPANKTLLYTVGFDIGSNSQEDKDARAFLSECASPGGYFYQADDADDLQDAFDDIASSLSELRLSK